MDEHDHPTPEPAYLALMGKMFAKLQHDAANAGPLTSPYDGAPDEVSRALATDVEGRAQDLVDLSHDIHAHPELCYEEHHAAAAVARTLGAAGHDVEVGAYGLDTAVQARAGDGHPRVAILAEYDALPGIGHACGHNVIASTAVGAFLAVAERIGDLGGSVELIGTPAEEGGGGKELIAQAGGFDDVDAAIMLHPAGFEVASHAWLGVRTVEITFTGLPAHASVMPFMGRNALDAVVQTYTGIAAMRQHMLGTDRVHGIITDGGQKPNIVPERASAEFFLRSAEAETLAVLCERVEAIARAAAAATATTVAFTWDITPVYLPVRNNQALAARWADNVVDRGRISLPQGIVPKEFTGSTDMGNVSVRVPSIHPTLAIAPPEVVIHAPEFAEHARSERADAGVVDGAIGLARTAADFLTDAALQQAVADEFEAAGGASSPGQLLQDAG